MNDVDSKKLEEIKKNWFWQDGELFQEESGWLLARVTKQDKEIAELQNKNKRVHEELNECRSKVAQMAVEKRYGQRHNGQ